MVGKKSSTPQKTHTQKRGIRLENNIKTIFLHTTIKVMYDQGIFGWALCATIRMNMTMLLFYLGCMCSMCHAVYTRFAASTLLRHDARCCEQIECCPMVKNITSSI